MKTWNQQLLDYIGPRHGRPGTELSGWRYNKAVLLRGSATALKTQNKLSRGAVYSYQTWPV